MEEITHLLRTKVKVFRNLPPTGDIMEFVF